MAEGFWYLAESRSFFASVKPGDRVFFAGLPAHGGCKNEHGKNVGGVFGESLLYLINAPKRRRTKRRDETN